MVTSARILEGLENGKKGTVPETITFAANTIPGNDRGLSEQVQVRKTLSWYLTPLNP